eukprot:553973_1
MSTVRFNAFIFKALSGTSIRSYPSSTTLCSRHFAKKSEKLPKAPTKSELKLEKLLKQYPDPLAPKRPSSSYLLYAVDYKAKFGLKTSPETMRTISKQIAASWRDLPETEKSAYTQRYAQNKNEWLRAKEIYDNENRAQFWKDKVSKLSKTKPPNSGYQLFMKSKLGEVRQQNPMALQPEVLSMAAKAWSDLEETEKKTWADKAKYAVDEWERQLK